MAGSDLPRPALSLFLAYRERLGLELTWGLRWMEVERQRVDDPMERTGEILLGGDCMLLFGERRFP